MEYDVIIVGAGPAGSTTARFCAKEGLKTLLIKKNRLPRYKPCGGCLSPRALQELDFDVGGIIENTFSEAKLTFRLEDPFSLVSRHPIGHLVMRESFDHFLCRKAQEEGTVLYEGRTALGFQQDPEGVSVSIKGGEFIRCRYLVGPDGARSIVARSLLGGAVDRMGMAFGGEARLPLGREAMWAFVHLDLGIVPHGYGWIFPKGDFVSIGIATFFPTRGMKLRSRFERFVGGVDYLREVRMERACLHPLPSFSAQHPPVSRGRVLLAGDAAHLMEAITGEGIYYAVKSGKMAGEAIIRAIKEGHERIGEYPEALRCVLFRELTVANNLAKAIYRFPKLAYNLLKASKGLGLLYIDILAGNARYEAFSRKMIDGMRRRLGNRITPMVTLSSAPD